MKGLEACDRDTEVDRTEVRVCGRGGRAGGAGQGELKATERGGECTKEVKVTVLGDSAVQGFSSSA